MQQLLNISHTNAHVKDNLTRLSAFTGTFAELCRILYKPKITPDKLTSGYLTRCVINGARNNENALDIANLLIADGDSQIDTNTGEIINGAVNPWEVHLILDHLGIDHLIYSSHSNDAHVRKYRVLIPCQYTRHDLPILLDWLFARLHENGVMLADVKENRTWAQAWFKPSVHPDRMQHFKIFWRIDGKASNPLRDDTEIEFVPSEMFWAEKIIAEAKQKSIVNESITTLSRVKPAVIMSANPIAEFNANFSVHDVLIRNGYKQQGKRYLHPNSASKIAGVRILDTGRAYSDSSDSLNDGKSHDAFDCFRLLECGGDMKAALNWNSDITRANQRAFYDVPEKQNPQQNNSATGLRYSVQLPSFENLLGSQAQISNHATV